MANFYGKYSGIFGGSGGGSGGGVTSLNSETGDIDLTSVDSSVTITPSGQTIDLSVSVPSFGDLTDAGTDGIIVTGGTGAVHGSGTSIAQHIADTSHNGYLSSTDWNTFNGKGSGTVTSISVASANGLAGSSSGGATPALTLSTSITGILQGDGTAISAATTTGSGSVVLATAPTMSSPVVGTQSQGDASTKAASTAYVDTAVANAVSGINPAVAVQAATTSASNTSGLTYNNGVSGIGATFTGSNNTAIIVDGYTFTAIGQRLLVKNDTQSPSGAFNGVYYVTQVQTSILPPILTRALDYDTPSDMNNTGAIPVINGTVNGTTSWVLTSQVVTVGTTPLVFTLFTNNPASYVSSTLNSGNIIVGNGSNVATAVAMSGGATISNSGVVTLANPSASTLGGVESISAVSHNFLTSISTSGVPAQAQPAFTDISGTATIAQTTIATQAVGTVTTTTTVTWSSGSVFTITLTSGDTCVVTFSGAVSGQTIVVEVTNGGSGGTGIITWPTVKWAGGTAPTQTTGTAALDVYTFVYNGSYYVGSVVQNLS